MTPEEIASKGNESSHQMALFAMCSMNEKKYPELRWFYSTPNGETRGSTKKHAMIVGARLKAGGVKAGVLDCFLPVKRGKWSGLFIELKKPGKIKNTSKEQKEFIQFVESQSFATAVFDNWVDAWQCLVQYLEWKE